MEVDDEWKHFLINANLDNANLDNPNLDNPNLNNSNLNNSNLDNPNLDNLNLDNPNLDNIDNIKKFSLNERHIYDVEPPKPSSLYISTKTKIIYLNIPIDIYNIFWKVKINDYDIQEEGIIKKQMKISSLTKEKLDEIMELTKNEKNVFTNVINHIDNPNGRIIFKDIRKISIGISKKDLLYTRSKNKSAFYNCFVLTIRIKQNNIFKEFHVKIFNTGKLEIPGIQKDETLYIIIEKIITILQNITKEKIHYLKNKTENVLINSNFNCGFYINREKLFNILRYKYKINANYDSCSYPGIQCVYYYSDKENKEDNIKISFMIFRTGSILIVGKCDEDVLNYVYDFIKKLLQDEYLEIYIKNIDNTSQIKSTKQVKLKKKLY